MSFFRDTFCVEEHTPSPHAGPSTLSDIGTYGKQLGRIGDALMLLAHFHPREPLRDDEIKAIDALKDMLEKIAAVKEKHSRSAHHPNFSSSPS